MAIVNASKCYINANCYTGCQTITSIDLKNTPWVNNSMASAFGNCSNLSSVTNINNNVTYMWNTFSYCKKMVNAPLLPDSVTNINQLYSGCYELTNPGILPPYITNLYYVFSGCYKLESVPSIPNSVTDISYAYSSCSNLLYSPTIPNSVTNMKETFGYCYRLSNMPSIPDSVINMYRAFSSCNNMTITNNYVTIGNGVTHMRSTFYNCSKLSGDICIFSPNVSIANNCFDGCDIYNKYVWIKPNTTTWNSFINAGYNTNGTTNKVFMREWDGTFSNLTVNVTPNTATVNIVDVNDLPRTYYAWYDSGDGVCFYTLTETPTVNDPLYDYYQSDNTMHIGNPEGECISSYDNSTTPPRLRIWTLGDSYWAYRDSSKDKFM